MCIFLCFNLCGLCALCVKFFGLDSSKPQHRVHREKITEFTEKTCQPCIDKWEGRVANCARFPFSTSVSSGRAPRFT
jgi:hypothetical protein